MNNAPYEAWELITITVVMLFGGGFIIGFYVGLWL